MQGEREGEIEKRREEREERKVGKHGLILNAGATDQSQTDGVGRSRGVSINLQNISQTHTNTHGHI